MVGFVFGVLAFLYLPIVVLVVFSFNDSKVTSFPLSGFTWHWYQAVFANAQMLTALKNSLIVATCATGLTLTIGTLAALVLDRHDFPGRGCSAMRSSPSLPGLVTGIAMLNFYKQIGIPQSLTAVVIGHATALLGVVVSQVMARLAKTDHRLLEASADLGAGPVETFFRVTLPAIRPAILGAGLLSFTLSFDEIPVTYFLTGRDITLPIYIYSTLRRGITPEINAIGSLIVLVSLLLIILSVGLLRDRK
ncbi:ABC transporter permease [Rhodobacter capsulatus]|uniref:ABC transporter permease n=1 Tax=Rhodobacter capsulatus TaxID=1061 RepID=UPI0040295186